MAGYSRPAGTLCWFECGSTNAAKSKSFYMELFTWGAKDVPMPGMGGAYTLLQAGGEDIAGLYQLGGPGMEGIPSHWLTYIAVEEVDSTLKRAGEMGAKTLMGPMDVPNVGRIAVLRDSTEAVFAVAHFDAHPGTPEQGPFGWSELHTRDTAKAGEFYQSLFHWTSKLDAKHGYTEFQLGGRSIAGMMEMTPQHGAAPPNWLPYVAVGDCDATAQKTKELGGNVIVPPMDIENVGRFSILTDPGGAALGVIKLTHM